MFTKILLAIDGSDCSINAATKAIQLARAFAADLHVLYVSAPYAYLTQEERKEFNQKARATADKAFADVRSGLDDVSITTLFKEGEKVSAAIMETATEIQADVIVLGSHGYSGLNRLVLGSVANDVVTKAKCPVLVCKPE